MNKLLNALTNEFNYKTTENGAIALKSTKSKVYDMFAFGGAYRTRSEADCILLFKEAFAEDAVLATKCLFYLGDVRGGQGERRFFRVCLSWMANEHPHVLKKFVNLIPMYRRWDDLYVLVGTPLEKDMWAFVREQINTDLTCKVPSLCAKWLKSENTSSKLSCELGNKTRKALGLSHKEYRKLLSHLRTRINIVERLMSSNQWDKIEFDKLPSKAGFIYRNAFARHEYARYSAFATSEETKVNASTLYPYEVVGKALDYYRHNYYSNTKDKAERAIINKYWDNLADYFGEASLNALAIVDTSGSMHGLPMQVAISLGLYCADKAKGPFHNHYISFSSRPQLVKCEGIDFVDKVNRIYDYCIVDDTNLESSFDLVLNAAIENKLTQEDLPASLIVISDMEINSAVGYYDFDVKTTMAKIRKKWEQYGYKMPSLIYWNVNARNNTILDESSDATFVSGCSPVIFEQILKNKRGYDLMLDKLNSERYAAITF